MGTIYGYDCPECDFYKELTLGIGWAFDPLAFREYDAADERNMWNVTIQDKKILADIEEIINQKDGRLDDTNYGYELYYSKTCKSLYSRFYFKLRYLEDGLKKVYTPKYYDENGKRLKKVTEKELSSLELECPKCKGEIHINPDAHYVSMCWD